ncbi:hypothetical protein AVEN_256863-1 [Araneus ventricosus]|uniref:Uncharacterized protein n=1 Tax=Araneus ventricosus TaxID=182803 RepID=A0A4Y2RKN5_ARAVE|nr:hypothetical protein AVEN_256863-1 [Araneus ventricosus]
MNLLPMPTNRKACHQGGRLESANRISGSIYSEAIDINEIHRKSQCVYVVQDQTKHNLRGNVNLQVNRSHRLFANDLKDVIDPSYKKKKKKLICHPENSLISK